MDKDAIITKEAAKETEAKMPVVTDVAQKISNFSGPLPDDFLDPPSKSEKEMRAAGKDFSKPLPSDILVSIHWN